MATSPNRETPSEQRAWRTFEPAFEISDRERNDGSGSFLILKIGSRDITPNRVLAEHDAKLWGVKWANVKVGNGFFPITLAFDSVEQIQRMASDLAAFAADWASASDVDDAPEDTDDAVAQQMAANAARIADLERQLAARPTSTVVPQQSVPPRRIATNGASGKRSVQAALAAIPKA